MPKFAPIEYIQDYNEGSLSNVGCGPLFYEDLWHFGEVPEHYVGVDFNTNTFEYLEQSQHPRLIESRKYVESHNIQTEVVAESAFDWAAETDYRYSGTEGPTPDEFIDWAEKGGFKLMERRILTTDRHTYKWDSIHVSAFRME